MNNFELKTTNINGLAILKRKIIADQRGFISRLFCDNQLSKFFLKKEIKQINHSFTRKVGSIRGMHYQKPPSSEVKLITCIKGRVFDVAVDIRKNSPTFLCWHAEVLSEENQKSFLIPEGFAHGFQTLEENSELIYIHTASYDQINEASLNPMDERLAINWQLPVTEISEKDKLQPMIVPEFLGIEI
jgi:dTDP-4-dehydrorhamnose 3,5-epimerase